MWSLPAGDGPVLQPLTVNLWQTCSPACREQSLLPREASLLEPRQEGYAGGPAAAGREYIICLIGFELRASPDGLLQTGKDIAVTAGFIPCETSCGSLEKILALPSVHFP